MVLQLMEDGEPTGNTSIIICVNTRHIHTTVFTEVLFLSLIIDTKEVQDIAICDIPGAYLQREKPKGTHKVHIKLDGAMN